MNTRINYLPIGTLFPLAVRCRVNYNGIDNELPKFKKYLFGFIRVR